jgi:hypothetical protein
MLVARSMLELRWSPERLMPQILDFFGNVGLESGRPLSFGTTPRAANG